MTPSSQRRLRRREATLKQLTRLMELSRHGKLTKGEKHLTLRLRARLIRLEKPGLLER